MDADILFSIQLSLQVAFAAVFFLLITAVPLAWIFARRLFPCKRLLESLFALPLVLPPTVLGYYLVILLGRNGLIGYPLYELTGWSVVFSWWGAVVASTVVAFPLLFQTARIAISGVDPELEEIAYTMGASKLQMFCYVTLPLAKRGLCSGIALSFARAMGEFGATLMIAGNVPGKTTTMPMAIYNAFAAGKLTQANALVAIYTALCLLVLIYVAAGGLISKEKHV